MKNERHQLLSDAWYHDGIFGTPDNSAALCNMEDDGLLTREAVGDRYKWVITPAGTSALRASIKGPPAEHMNAEVVVELEARLRTCTITGASVEHMHVTQEQAIAWARENGHERAFDPKWGCDVGPEAIADELTSLLDGRDPWAALTEMWETTP